MTTRTIHRLLPAALLAIAAAAVPARGQCQESRLGDFGGGQTALFGPYMPVAISGDGATAAVRNRPAGAVHVFRLVATWGGEVVVEPGEPPNSFGQAVALSHDGDVLLVGAPGDDQAAPGAGAAYVMRRDARGAWSQEAKLLPPRAGAEDADFGWAVWLSAGADTALVVARDYDNESGGAFAYRRTRDGTWALEHEILDLRGWNAAGSADGGTLVVGSGSEARIVRRDELGVWSMEATLAAPDGDPAGFGFGVAMSANGDTLVVGEYDDTVGELNCGSASIYERRGGTWTYVTTLVPEDLPEDPDIQFGLSVAISADAGRIAVGARYYEDVWYRQGAVYVYDRDEAGWTWTSRLTSIRGEWDALGRRLGISADGRRVIAGAGGNQTAYVFDLDGADCNANRVCDNEDIGTGSSADANANGSPDECEQPAPWCAPARVIPDDVGEWSLFGWSAAVSGDTAVLGARYEDDTGSAYVYRHGLGGWNLEQKLRPAGATESIRFGEDVAIDGDVAVVGAPYDGDQVGAVYVFRRAAGRWAQEQVLVPPDGVGGDQIGARAIDVEGDLIAVGVPAHGAVYPYTWDGTTWTLREPLVSPGPGNFGRELAIDDGVIAVGAWGTVHLFEDPINRPSAARSLVGPDGWTLRTGLDIDGTTIVIGASKSQEYPVMCVFTKRSSEWAFDQMFTLPADISDWIDILRVALSGDLLVAANPVSDLNGSNSGSAYLYRRDGETWAEAAPLPSPDPAQWQQYGVVAMDGGLAFVAAPTDQQAAENAGAAYAFDFRGPCTGDQNGDGVLDVLDLALLLDAWGPCPAPPDFCPGDVDGDGVVGTADLLAMLEAWVPG